MRVTVYRRTDRDVVRRRAGAICSDRNLTDKADGYSPVQNGGVLRDTDDPGNVRRDGFDSLSRRVQLGEMPNRNRSTSRVVLNHSRSGVELDTIMLLLTEDALRFKCENQ